MQLPETPKPSSGTAMEEEEGEGGGTGADADADADGDGGKGKGRGPQRRTTRKRKRAKSQPEPTEPEPEMPVVVAVREEEEKEAGRLKALVAEARALARRLGALFEWSDGPLVEAMRGGHVLLLDEVGGDVCLLFLDLIRRRCYSACLPSWLWEWLLLSLCALYACSLRLLM